jgi:hypothetical protein
MVARGLPSTARPRFSAKEHVLMTRSILCGLLGLVSVGALCIVPLACSAGHVGDPCTPEDEYKPDFAGFKMQEENIESRSFQCATRICLVNHFQGRVSCPRGQTKLDVVFCDPQDEGACDKEGLPDSVRGGKCVVAQTLAPDCDSDSECGGLVGTVCDPVAKVCKCTGSQLPENYFCEPSNPDDSKSLRVLKSYVCHKDDGCQRALTPGQETKDYEFNKDKQCCIPGTDTPVTVPVCGQCTKNSRRNAEGAVYCSCRCLRDGEEGDPNFNYCSCPDGFQCTEIRKFVGLGDKQLAGSYCIRENSAYKPPGDCGEVNGNASQADNCEGVAVSNLE